ncbi:prephenate dehydrogenase [Thermospira aquatica]|uniref:Prephenate dehydrogenase n=1 Tax=Thermospira aquatica TaxID=2828656 RepID=A0AAX3BD84_9SPIR|nr:prephenate dehydrogenase [Thermospira aquatica]URA10206.1 prephenate dehydrogenase [Thermospira aquatica]
MEFKKIGIYGLGLIGGSIGLAVKTYLPGYQVYGFGRNKDKLQNAKALGMIDGYATDMDLDLIETLDIFIIATPPEEVAVIFERFMPSLKEDVIVMDVASIKRHVVDAVEKVNSRRLAFVGTHPMSGSEKAGLEFARADLFEKKIVAIVGDHNDEVLEVVRDFWKAFGAQIVIVSADFHDEIVAATSHVPHLVAAAISSFLEKDGWSEVRFFGLYGKGLLDTTRIAQGNPSMWVDIVFKNADNIERSLMDFSREIDTLLHLIRNGKKAELEEYLKKAKEFRETL